MDNRSAKAPTHNPKLPTEDYYENLFRFIKQNKN